MNQTLSTLFVDPGLARSSNKNSWLQKEVTVSQSSSDFDVATEAIDIARNSKRLKLKDVHVFVAYLYPLDPVSRKLQANDLERFFSSCRNDALNEITSDRVALFLKESSDLNVQEKVRIEVTLKAFFAFCVKNGHLKSNPWEDFRLPILYFASSSGSDKKAQQASKKSLCKGDVEKMLALEPNKKNQLFIRLVAYLGLTVFEVTDLTMDSFRQDGGHCFIIVGEDPKTRKVTIPEHWRDEALRFKYTYRETFPSITPLFRTKNTMKSLSPAAGWDIVRKAAQRAGVQAKVSQASLRKFYEKGS